MFPVWSIPLGLGDSRTGVSFPYADRYVSYGAILTPVASNFGAVSVLDMTAFGDLSGGQGHRSIMRIAEDDENPTNFTFGVGQYGVANDTRLALAYNVAGVWYDHFSTSEVPITGKHMIGFTTDGTTIYFYIDGVFVSSTARLGPGFPTAGTWNAVGLGKPNSPSSGNHSPRAVVDYVAYWDRFLTSADMAVLGDATKSPLFVPINLKFYADLNDNTTAGCRERITRTTPTFTGSAPDLATSLGVEDPITHIETVESNSTAESTSHVVNMPPLAQPGDRVIVGLCACDGTTAGTYQALTGWTLRQEGAMSGINRFAIYERVVPAGGLGATVTFTSSQACGFVGFASIYRPATGYDAEFNVISALGSGTGSTATIPSATSTKAMGMRLYIGAFDDDDAAEGTFFPATLDPRAYVEQATPGNGAVIGMADDIHELAGATGTVVFDNSLSEEWNAITIVIVAARTVSVAAVFNGSASLQATAAAGVTVTAAATLNVLATIAAVARLTANGQTSLNAVATVTAAGRTNARASTSLLGGAALAPVSRITANAGALLNGIVTITGNPVTPQVGAAVLNASASLLAVAGAIRQAAALLNAAASINAASSASQRATALLNALTSLSGQPAALVTNSALLNALASLSPKGGLKQTASAQLSAVVTVQAIAIVLSTELDPEEITGRMYFEVLSGGVIVGAGPIQRVFQSGIQHKLDSVGRWAFTIDIADEYVSLLQHGREIHIFREGEGVIAKGIIGTKEIAPA